MDIPLPPASRLLLFLFTFISICVAELICYPIYRSPKAIKTTAAHFADTTNDIRQQIARNISYNTHNTPRIRGHNSLGPIKRRSLKSPGARGPTPSDISRGKLPCLFAMIKENTHYVYAARASTLPGFIPINASVAGGEHKY